MLVKIKQYDVLQSTNVTAVEFAKEGYPEGTVILADQQRQGKGRMSRCWSSPLGGLWFSIILRPTMNPEYVAQITLLTGVVVAKVLRDLYDTEEIKIKWPNDILFKDKKVCGILAESALTEVGTVNYAVVGVGINVGIHEDDIPAEIRKTAASLNIECKKDFTVNDVLKSILAEFELMYNNWQAQGAEVFMDLWKKMNCTLNKQVLVKDDDQVIFSGVVTDVNHYGAIVVQNENGTSQEFNFGEISIR